MTEELWIKRFIPLIEITSAICPEFLVTSTVNNMREHFEPITEYKTFVRVFEADYLEIEFRA